MDGGSFPRGWRRAPGSNGESDRMDETRLLANELPQGVSGRQRRESESSPACKGVTALLPPSFLLPHSFLPSFLLPSSFLPSPCLLPSSFLPSFLLPPFLPPDSFHLPSCLLPSLLLLSSLLSPSFLPPSPPSFNYLLSESRNVLQRPPVAGFLQ